MSPEPHTARRVGLTVLAALAVLAIAVLLIGDRHNLFRTKNRYFVRVASVAGLAEGSVVQLNGVNIGSVAEIVLPVDMGQNLLEVWIEVDSRYEQRFRQDSVARIKTLGLLGDKYVEVTSGSPAAPMLPERGEIPAAPQTNVEQLAAAGEDVMNNVVTISAQLSKILGRMERGEGLLGEMTKDVEPGRNVSSELLDTLESLKRIAQEIEKGPGALPRLVHDEQLGARMASAVERLDRVTAQLETGSGLLPGLLNDAEQKQRFTRALEGLESAAQRLAGAADRLESHDPLLGRLLSDREYGRRVTGELERILVNLREVSEKLNKGEGSAARLINDPQFAEALENVVVGVNESKLLSWLIRSRQKKGIEKRYQDAGGPADPDAPEGLPEGTSPEPPRR